MPNKDSVRSQRVSVGQRRRPGDPRPGGRLHQLAQHDASYCRRDVVVVSCPPWMRWTSCMWGLATVLVKNERASLYVTDYSRATGETTVVSVISV